MFWVKKKLKSEDRTIHKEKNQFYFAPLEFTFIFKYIYIAIFIVFIYYTTYLTQTPDHSETEGYYNIYKVMIHIFSEPIRVDIIRAICYVSSQNNKLF